MANDISGTDILLTVFLRHDQSQPLEEFQGKLNARGWWQRFPPEGVEVVSWNVVMGIGQIVTLRLPPDRLQAVNVELERSAWGVFRTETFISYDFMKVRERLAREAGASATAQPANSGAGGGSHPRLPPNGLFLEPVQGPPPSGADPRWEQQLGDAMEDAYRRGLQSPDEIAAALNEAGVAPMEGDQWTADGFVAAMAWLGGETATAGEGS